MPRIQLHSGLSRSAKIVLGSILLVAALVLAPLLGLIAGALTYALASHVAGVIVGVVVALVFAAMLVGRLLWVVRSAAWLESTTLVVRGALRTGRCDLATAARVSLDDVPETTTVPVAGGVLVTGTGRRVPWLTAHDAANGRRLRLPLRDPATRAPLTPPKLDALADAIQAGRRQEPRAGQVARTLHAMAAGQRAAMR
jgi:hypothetical protein